MKEALLSVFLLSQISGCFGPTGNQNLSITIHVSNSKTHTANCASEISDIIRDRLNRHGLTESEYQMRLHANDVELKLWKLVDAERTANLISRPGKIEFWETYENSEIYPYLREMNNLLAIEWRLETRKSKALNGEAEVAEGLLGRFGSDSASDNENSSSHNYSQDNPLWEVLSPAGSAEGLYSGPVVGYAAKKDTATVNQYLNKGNVGWALPRDLKFLWSFKPVDVTDSAQVFQLIAIKMLSRAHEPVMDGSAISGAEMQLSSFDDMPEITMRMNEEGARNWARLTRNNVGRSLAVVLDDKVYSFPTVQSEILGGISSITGNFTEQEAIDMANVLSSTAFPCKVKVIGKQITTTE